MARRSSMVYALRSALRGRYWRMSIAKLKSPLMAN